MKGGVKDEIQCVPKSAFSYITTDGTPVDKIEKNIVFKEKLTAPISEGAVIGKITYTLNGEEIGSVDIIATETVEKAGLGYAIKQIFKKLIL